jgi:hypothetical protein
MENATFYSYLYNLCNPKIFRNLRNNLWKYPFIIIYASDSQETGGIYVMMWKQKVFFFSLRRKGILIIFLFFFFCASGSWKLEGIDLLGKKNLYRPRRDHDQDWTRPKECRPIMMPATVWSEPYHQSMTSSSQSISLNGLLLSHVPLFFYIYIYTRK